MKVMPSNFLPIARNMKVVCFNMLQAARNQKDMCSKVLQKAKNVEVVVVENLLVEVFLWGPVLPMQKVFKMIMFWSRIYTKSEVVCVCVHFVSPVKEI